MSVWHGGEEHIPQFQMALGWGGGWAPLSSSGTCEAELRAPLSPAFTGQAGTREWRVVPVQQDIRHRACRINTHPSLRLTFYTSQCLSGSAAQSLFLNSLLYYTGQKIVAAWLLPGQACCSATHPRDRASCPHRAWRVPCPVTGVRCRVGCAWPGPHPSLQAEATAGTAYWGAWLHLCCCEPAAGTRVLLQSVSSHWIRGMPVLLRACSLREVNELKVSHSITKCACCWCQYHLMGAGKRTSSCR